jgi:hypothetical protein
MPSRSQRRTIRPQPLLKRASVRRFVLNTIFSRVVATKSAVARQLNELRERTEEVERLNQHLERRVADQVGEIEHTCGVTALQRSVPTQTPAENTLHWSRNGQAKSATA